MHGPFFTFTISTVEVFDLHSLSTIFDTLTHHGQLVNFRSRPSNPVYACFVHHPITMLKPFNLKLLNLIEWPISVKPELSQATQSSSLTDSHINQARAL